MTVISISKISLSNIDYAHNISHYLTYIPKYLSLPSNPKPERLPLPFTHQPTLSNAFEWLTYLQIEIDCVHWLCSVLFPRIRVQQ